MYTTLLLLYSVFAFTVSAGAKEQIERITLSSQASDASSLEINVELPQGMVIFADTITFSVDNPAIKVSRWQASIQPIMFFDRTAGLSRKSYAGSFTLKLSCTIDATAPPIESILFFGFVSNKYQFPQEHQLNLQGNKVSLLEEDAHPWDACTSQQEEEDSTIVHHSRISQKYFWTALYESVYSLILQAKELFRHSKMWLVEIFTQSHSSTLQLIISLCLGLLMSLTPCMYPMIPITIGVLGTSKSNSWRRNFLLACSYASGLALVFAALGLFTVLFGSHCGQLLCQPFFVVALVGFLIYCGGSMLDLYEFYIPPFLQPQPQMVHKGSFLSAFAFGAVSGTIASPCMSPGLALVLTAAAATHNYLQGFLLLLLFGIGTSVPLLIIGTFSGSLHLMPRAGMWMNDVKKFFGYMLIMISFNYLKAIMSPCYPLWAGALFSVICGLLYSLNVLHYHSWLKRFFVLICGIIFVGVGIFYGYLGHEAWQAESYYHGQKHLEIAAWRTDYDQARIDAQKENKLLLLDFTASWCSLCMMIDKQILHHADLRDALSKVIAIKVDGSSPQNKVYTKLFSQFHLLGIPTLLLIDPATETIIARWDSTLLERSASFFAQEILDSVEKKQAVV